MELDLGISRSTLALAGAMTWIGTGLGGIVMGWLADRIGIRNSVLMGTVMVASGLALSSTGHVWALYVGHGVLIGFLGMGAIYPPLLIYVSRWFDRKRGTAIALISSGQYVAGMVWPPVRAADCRARLADHLFGLRGRCVAGYAAARRSVPPPGPGRVWHGRQANRKRAYGNPSIPGASTGLRPNVCAGDHLCGQRVLLRADGDPAGASGGVLRGLGIGAATGATMLSVLLGCAFISRQFWGAFADRYGGCEDRARRLGLAGGVDRRLPAHSRTRLGCSLSRPPTDWGFAGIIPRLRGGDPRPVPVRRGVLAHPTGPVHRDERNGIRQLVRRGHLRSFRLLPPAFGFGVMFNIANLALVSFLLFRQSIRWRLVGDTLPVLISNEIAEP